MENKIGCGKDCMIGVCRVKKRQKGITFVLCVKYQQK
jgi:hypothetical protein